MSPESLGRRVARVVAESGRVGAAIRFALNLIQSSGVGLSTSCDRILSRVPLRLLTSRVTLDRLAQNKQVEMRHAGETCFILGTGPSLRQQDMSTLADKTVMTVNQGFLHCASAGLSPHYAVVVDEAYCGPGMGSFLSDIAAFCVEQDTEIFAHILSAKILEAKGTKLARDKVHYLAPIMRSRTWDAIGRPVPLDLTAAQPGYESVIHAAIVIALYMGFSKIVLLGCDMDYHTRPDARYAHAYEDSPYIADTKKVRDLFEEDQVELMERAHAEYRAFAQLGLLAQARGQSIVNATSGGYLDVFPRVDLADMVEDTGSAMSGGRSDDR